jgi:uncharacterized lipoprotein YmbA
VNSRGARHCGTLVAAALGLLSACASPREHLYTLDVAPEQNSAATGARPTVVVGPVSLPELIDRPQLVVRSGNYDIVINEQERWAEPLKDQLPRLLAAELSRRVADRRFAAASSSAINGPSAHLLIDIGGVDMAHDSGVRLTAHWVYRPVDPQESPVEGDSAAHTEIVLSGYVGYVDALRRAGIAIADDIAARLLR